MTVCRRCKHDSIPLGRSTCRFCGYVQGAAPDKFNRNPALKDGDTGIVSLAEVQAEEDVPRYVTGILDDVFGSVKRPGLVKESVTIFGAVQGFGKSTLCLQLLARIAAISGRPGLYVGIEESGEAVKARAMRLRLSNLESIKILTLEAHQKGHVVTKETMQIVNPSAVIIDSVQSMSGDSQREATRIAHIVYERAKTLKIPHIIICQVKKDGEFEGENKMLHKVDTLLIGRTTDTLEFGEDVYYASDYSPPGVKRELFRIVAAEVKNRYAPLNEAYFTMGEEGLKGFRPKGVK